MKKVFLFLIVLVTMVACSKSDSSSNNTEGGNGSISGYNPPSWIVGQWVNDIAPSIGYSFTSKDFCLIGTSSTCYLSGAVANIVTKVEQEIKDDVYTFSIQMNGSSTVTHTFKRISDNKIAKLDLKGDTETTYTKR